MEELEKELREREKQGLIKAIIFLNGSKEWCTPERSELMVKASQI